MKGYRCCAAMMVRAFRFLEAVSRKTEALCVFHFQSISTSVWLFRFKHGPTLADASLSGADYISEDIDLTHPQFICWNPAPTCG
jgi:hypothetical protein